MTGLHKRFSGGRKKGVNKEMLRARLLDVYQDSGVDVWDAEFVWE